MALELSLQNPVVECFVFYATVAILKLMFLTLVTAYHRFTKKVFANPEDVDQFKGKVAVNLNHPDVERTRRNHLNDIENIIPFVLVGILYVLTGPTLPSARLHFRIFTAARFIHTFVYLCAVPQPARGLAHFVSIGVIFSMAYTVINTAMKAM